MRIKRIDPSQPWPKDIQVFGEFRNVRKPASFALMATCPPKAIESGVYIPGHLSGTGNELQFTINPPRKWRYRARIAQVLDVHVFTVYVVARDTVIAVKDTPQFQVVPIWKADDSMLKPGDDEEGAEEDDGSENEETEGVSSKPKTIDMHKRPRESFDDDASSDQQSLSRQSSVNTSSQFPQSSQPDGSTSATQEALKLNAALNQPLSSMSPNLSVVHSQAAYPATNQFAQFSPTAQRQQQIFSSNNGPGFSAIPHQSFGGQHQSNYPQQNFAVHGSQAFGVSQNIPAVSQHSFGGPSSLSNNHAPLQTNSVPLQTGWQPMGAPPMPQIRQESHSYPLSSAPQTLYSGTPLGANGFTTPQNVQLHGNDGSTIGPAFNGATSGSIFNMPNQNGNSLVLPQPVNGSYGIGNVNSGNGFSGPQLSNGFAAAQPINGVNGGMSSVVYNGGVQTGNPYSNNGYPVNSHLTNNSGFAHLQPGNGGFNAGNDNSHFSMIAGGVAGGNSFNSMSPSVSLPPGFSNPISGGIGYPPNGQPTQIGNNFALPQQQTMSQTTQIGNNFALPQQQTIGNGFPMGLSGGQPNTLSVGGSYPAQGFSGPTNITPGVNGFSVNGNTNQTLQNPFLTNLLNKAYYGQPSQQNNVVASTPQVSLQVPPVHMVPTADASQQVVVDTAAPQFHSNLTGQTMHLTSGKNAKEKHQD